MKKLWLFICFVLLFFGSATAQEPFDFSKTLKQAKWGDVEAMCDLGKAYFFGKQTLKDPFKAKCWIKKAYHGGSVRAKNIWNDLELWKYSGQCDAFFDDAPLPKYSKGSEYTEPITGMTFTYMPKGCFIMGCHPNAKKCKKDEKPGHKVCLDGFWMAKFEVTQAQWEKIMGFNPSHFSGHPSQPVENVSYNDIQLFIKQVNLQISGKVLLPTEAQWEYACRNGGKKTNFPWDEALKQPEANCGTCNPHLLQKKTTMGGRFAPNAVGIYDMAGNVKEWCRDYYDKKAYATHEKNNPVYVGKSSSRVVRGGSYNDNVTKLRCTARDKSLSGIRDSRTGFRLVIDRKE